MKKGQEYDIIIGTQALLTSSLIFDKVGLIVIDEQHRFGVAQDHRSKKGKRTAPPYYDRNTHPSYSRFDPLWWSGSFHYHSNASRSSSYKNISRPPYKKIGRLRLDWIKSQRGACQVFIICPLIEESESETLSPSEQPKRVWTSENDVFKGLRVSLLHGKLKPPGKESIMKEFSEGKIDILVSTSVVEVGIDIPNATIMIIEGAERLDSHSFINYEAALAEGIQSYCYLFSEIQDESKLKRLHFFAATSNGVKLAEYDLGQRVGNIFGTKQHGYLKLKIASLSDVPLCNRRRMPHNIFSKNIPTFIPKQCFKAK